MTQAEILELFDLYHNMVYRLAFAVTRSKQDAEDITQTVFLKLLDGESEQHHWRNIVISHLQLRKNPFFWMR